MSESGFAPTQCLIVDITEPLPKVGGTSQAGTPYAKAWILVLNQGEPVDVVEFELGQTPLTEAELLNKLTERLDTDEWSPRLGQVPERDLPSMSIVVPTTFGRFAQLEQCAERLSMLDYPDYEAIIVDNRPDRPAGPAERARIESYPHVTVVTEPVKGISAARNRGIGAANGDVIAFTDDDAHPHRSWLRALGARHVLEPEASCVSGLVVPAERETRAQELFELSGFGPVPSLKAYSYRSSASGHTSAYARDRFRTRKIQGDSTFDQWIYEFGPYGMGNNFSLKREYLKEFTGFNLALGVGTPTRGGEDSFAFVDLLLNGHTIAYEPAAIVSHSNRKTYSALREQIGGYGIGVTATLTALIAHDPRHLIGILRITGTAMRSLRNFSAPAGEGERPADFPKELTRLHRLGMVAGPFWYAVSRWTYRGSEQQIGSLNGQLR